VTRRRGRWLLAVLLGVLVIASVFSVNQSRLEIPLVVFLFLLMGMAVWDKDLRPAFVVGGSIPASALISFILFRMCGLSLNVMSLFGLALGMGMLVDNAIVVYENILHCREQTGPVADPAAQAMAATEQMVLPMIGATVTNAVTFLPFIFLSKNLQLMYWDVAAAVGASHFASVLVSLTVVPILSLKLLESKEINVRQPKALKHFLPFPSLLKKLFALWSAGVSPAWFRIKTFAGETPALQTSNRSEGWTNAIKRTAPTAITFIALLLIGLMILGWKGPSKWTYALVATLTTGVGLSLLRRYETIWHDLLKNRGKVLAGALALALAGGWILAKATDRDFESSGELDEFVIFVELSSGVKLDVANSVIHQVETRLNQDPQVARSILTAVARIEGWSSKLYITLRPRAERPLSTTRVIDRLRKSLDNVGRDVDENAFVHFSSPQTGREMTVQIQGPDYGVMEQLAQEVTAGLETIKGLADVKMRFRPGRPQVIVNVTPDSAARRGLTVDEVVETVHGQVRGLRATLLRSRSTQTEVIVRLRSADREKIQTLVDLPLLTRRGDRVRLGEVATLQLGQMPNEVFRENKQRLLQITANREKISLSRSAEEILKVLERIKFPRDYFGSLAGDYKETMRGFRQLSWGLLAMLVAVYLVLVVLFESVLQPLVIMATVPLCLIGVAWGLAVLGLPLSTGVMVGMMMLGGIVVNNGIMLLDHFNRHSPVGTGPLSTASGTENSIPCDQQYSVKAIDLPPASGEAQRLWDALRLASLARRRPILLTAGSAILGFLPLMLDTSETGALWRPLSVAMVFGLLVSTILTLFVVPCLTFALKQDVPRLLHRSNSPLLPVTTPSKLLQVVHNFFFES
jgi:HAE1 family hydrophobic/amphiphilic exporter-1